MLPINKFVYFGMFLVVNLWTILVRYLHIAFPIPLTIPGSLDP
jgi:hypothetical protein